MFTFPWFKKRCTMSVRDRWIGAHKQMQQGANLGTHRPRRAMAETSAAALQQAQQTQPTLEQIQQGARLAPGGVLE